MDKKEIYEVFCEREKELPIFFQPWYLDALGNGECWEVAVAVEKEQVVGAMPYFIKRKAIFSYVTMPVFARYLGPYIIEAKRSIKYYHKICTSLIEQLPEFDDFTIYGCPTMGSWLAFYWQGFYQTTRYTYQLDIQDLDKVYKNFSSTIRNNIRKAKRQNVTVIDDLSLEEYYEINKKSYDRQGVPVDFSFELLQRLDAVLAEKRQRKIFAVKDAIGNIHSVSYLIWDNVYAYYLLAGTDTAFRKHNTSCLLVWETMEFTKKELGLNHFDFCGSMVKGIEANRRLFRGIPTPYHQITKTPSTLMKIGRFFQREF